jgi:hypothetical protein
VCEAGGRAKEAGREWRKEGEQAKKSHNPRLVPALPLPNDPAGTANKRTALPSGDVHCVRSGLARFFDQRLPTQKPFARLLFQLVIPWDIGLGSDPAAWFPDAH